MGARRWRRAWLAVPGAVLAVHDLWRLSAVARAGLPGATGLPGPAFAMVVPARDEARLLPGCLQRLGGAGVTVVDDGSVDGTAVVARAAGARVVRAGPRPDGWAGKAWALARGTEATDQPWLVYVDADVRVGRDALGRLVAAADAAGVPAACLLGRQEGFLEFDAALLVARRGADFRRVNDDRSTYLVGQCLAVRRDALAAAGGWQAVRGSRVEDVDLGVRLGRHRAWSALGEVAVARRPGRLRTGWRKNMWRTHGGVVGAAAETGHLVATAVAPWWAGPGAGTAVYALVALTRLGARQAGGRGGWG